LTNKDDIWVIDTSSLIEIKHVVPRNVMKPVLNKMTELVSASRLHYPKEVIQELSEYKNKHKPDAPYEWAKNNEPVAATHDHLFADVSTLLRSKPSLATVLDSSKAGGAEEADLYVLALAVRLKAPSKNVLVITEESRQRPDRMPLSVACGVMRIYHYNIKAFLEDTEIWPKDYGTPKKKGPAES
jgi:hypothetical protein